MQNGPQETSSWQGDAMPDESGPELKEKYSPQDHTVEVRNRFKGLDLIDRVSEDLWREVQDIVQDAVNKTIQEKEMQKGKMVV